MGLNSRVIIRRPAAGQDDAGGPLAGWVPVDEVWCEVKHPSGAEALRGGAPVSTVQASIKVRLRSDIVAGMQAECAGLVYTVQAVLPDRVENRYMFLVCEASQ